MAKGNSKDDSKSLSYVPTLFGSAIAGALARIPTHPIDTCKARLQVLQKQKCSNTSVTNNINLWNTLRSTYQGEGVKGLYRGFTVTALGSIPASMLYFTTYEFCRDHLIEKVSWIHDRPFVGHFVSGMIAETVSCLLWVPIDVIKERMQVQKKGTDFYYRDTGHAFRSILYGPKGVRTLYSAYGATVLSFGPFSAFYFMFYEYLKHWSLSYYSARQSLTLSADQPSIVDESQLPLPYIILSGATAGASASFLTNPLDMVKLRLQLQRAPISSSTSATQKTPVFHFAYRNIFHGLYTVLHQEGFSALFRGVTARIAFHAPTTAIQIATFEAFKNVYKKHVQTSP